MELQELVGGRNLTNQCLTKCVRYPLTPASLLYARIAAF